MKLNELYSLRKKYTIIGLTGRSGSGCSETSRLLEDPKPPYPIITEYDFNNNVNNIKLNICHNFLKEKNNWIPFKTIKYKNVILLHLLYESAEGCEEISSWQEKILQVIFQNGKSKMPNLLNRFDSIDDIQLIDKIKYYFSSNTEDLKNLFEEFKKQYTNDNNSLNIKNFISNLERYQLIFKTFEILSNRFYEVLNNFNVTKRTRLVHDIANNLRAGGSIKNYQQEDLKHIYTVAQTINQLIKLYKNNNPNTKIVIDSLKNSLELMFFKEKYSAFYMIAINKSQEERQKQIETAIQKYANINSHTENIMKLDEDEYRGHDFTKGIFSSPDIENCIQKSDFHIYHTKNTGNKHSSVDSLENQIIKLIALIHQPGIITPTAIERCMQVAFNAKLNSGCISRQVGAVITDANFSIKAIGWNDVAQGQMPCNLRSIQDLINGKNDSHFSDYEKNGGEFMVQNDKRKFIDLLKIDNIELAYKVEELEGRNCSFCFKTYQNVYEGEKNQVHTRSLHAEENAMLQIVKNGGNAVKGGNLFTTASPCELCSKKAFQLGIINIYYIDPYPGISTTHILKSGISKKDNPKLIMFQGAVGRTFHKLYEPFMSYKDELSILSGIEPSPPKNLKVKKLREILKDVVDDKLKDKLDERLKDENDVVKTLLDLINKGLDLETQEKNTKENK